MGKTSPIPKKLVAWPEIPGEGVIEPNPSSQGRDKTRSAAEEVHKSHGNHWAAMDKERLR